MKEVGCPVAAIAAVLSCALFSCSQLTGKSVAAVAEFCPRVTQIVVVSVGVC